MNMRDALKRKGHLLARTRQFFSDQGVIEVQTPKLLNSPVTDIYIDSLSMRVNQDIGLDKTQYLHTSPELEMKKLLAKGSGDIYQICSVFRNNEQGSQNTNEFTMLEYYRLDFNMHQLMNDITKLLKTLGINQEISKLSYAQAFSKYADIDILNTDFSELKSIAKTHGLTTDFEWIEDLQILLFTHLIEPNLQNIPVCFIYDYPSGQSALSVVKGDVAHRFELYLDGVEIANGYDELRHADEYLSVFRTEIKKRQALGKFTPNIDQEYLDAIDKSLPKCAGVAIGIDRLFEQID